MKDRPLVLVCGEAGVGKSAVIAQLLGVNIRIKAENRELEITPSAQPGASLPHYPQIGTRGDDQKTQCVKGFNTGELVLVDCPAFMNSEEQDYEFCANLSTDSLLKAARSLESVVLVIPASAFFEDDGNAVVKAMRKTHDRFPCLFPLDEQESEVNSKFFIRITKMEEINPNQYKQLLDLELLINRSKKSKEKSQKFADVASL